LKPVVVSFILAAQVAGWEMQKLLDSMEFHTHLSWWIFAIAGLGSAVIAIITISIHSLRAAQANPVSALQSE
jgi:ABC-type antimicrobial peptide transport system permease subunit